jgi:hypothetical protein
MGSDDWTEHDCFLCNFTITEEQRRLASTDPGSERYNAFVHVERLFRHWPCRPSATRAKFVCDILKTQIKRCHPHLENFIDGLTPEIVVTHFGLHSLPTYRELCEEQFYQYRLLSDKFTRSIMGNDENVDRSTLLKQVVSLNGELRKLCREIASN